MLLNCCCCFLAVCNILDFSDFLLNMFVVSWCWLGLGFVFGLVTDLFDVFTCSFAKDQPPHRSSHPQAPDVAPRCSQLANHRAGSVTQSKFACTYSWVER